MTFSGTVESDFLKLGQIPEVRKTQLVDFAGTDFVTLRANLIKYVQAVYPLDYNNFSESDLGIMLIELVAYMGAVMSLKADMLANENYLSTATNRNNVRKILQLLGVDIKGPKSAVGTAKYTIEGGINVNSLSSVTIAKENRVAVIVSPEDNASVNYTLYQTVNGQVELQNSTGDLVLEGTDFIGDASNVYTNLVLQEGSLIVESGQFSPAQSIKTVSLTKFPIIEASIQVFIDGPVTVSGEYTEVENLFFASGSNDRVFQKVYDDNFGATIVFGDNVLGTSPTTDSTYTIFYRVGGGTRGILRNQSLNVSLKSTYDSATVTGPLENISVIVGGQDAETVEHAKRFAPYTFRRQDRLVTGEDFTVFANQFTSNLGVQAKAIATVSKAFSSALVIEIYVLERASTTQLQRASVDYKANLLEAMEEKKMIGPELRAVDGLIRGIDLTITASISRELQFDEEVIKSDISDAVVGFFNLDNREFGQPLVIADLQRTIFNLESVLFASIDGIDADIQVDFNEIISLNNTVINIVFI